MPLGIVSNDEFEAEVSNSATVYSPPIPSNTITPSINQPGEVVNNENEFGPIVTSDLIIKRIGSGAHGNQGRNIGDGNVPPSLRKMIGDTAVFDSRGEALELAGQFGISPSAVSNYTHPTTSAPGLSKSSQDDIHSFLTNKKNKITKRATNKLNLALSFINEDKLMELGARDLSAVAKDMSAVVKNMEPPAPKEDTKAPVQFHFYAPQVKNETHYATVVAKDNY